MIRFADKAIAGGASPEDGAGGGDKVVQPGLPPAPLPQMIDVNEFATMLVCSVKHVRRMADSGKCPAPIRLGALQRWSRKVVDDWIAAGCPPIRQVRLGRR